MAESGKRETGRVKWFNNNKGYGFITLDSGAGDVFVHYRHIVGDGFRTLEDGKKVSFIVREGQKGLQAEQVSIDES